MRLWLLQHRHQRQIEIHQQWSWQEKDAWGAWKHVSNPRDDVQDGDDRLWWPTPCILLSHTVEPIAWWLHDPAQHTTGTNEEDPACETFAWLQHMCPPCSYYYTLPMCNRFWDLRKLSYEPKQTVNTTELTWIKYPLYSYCTSSSSLFSVVMSHSVESGRSYTDGRIDLVAENGGFCSDLLDINENARSNQQANQWESQTLLVLCHSPAFVEFQKTYLS